MTEYVYDDTVLNYICPNGSHGSITWGDWQKGKRCDCVLCRKDRRKKNLKRFVKVE